MSSTTDYLPRSEADLVAWSNNMSARLAAFAYGLNPGQVTGYQTLHGAWISAFNAANADISRTPVSIIAKNVAKNNLIDGTNGIRQLVSIIQANPATTDVQRGELQITVRDVEPSPVPIPATPPDLSVVSVFGRTAKLRLKDAANAENRGKPDGVSGATILYHIGATAPFEPNEWLLLEQTTRTKLEVQFPTTIEPGAKVWLTAYWYNTKAQSSTAAEAVSLRIGDTMAEAA